MDRDLLIIEYLNKGYSYNKALLEAHKDGIRLMAKEKYLILKKLVDNKPLTEKQEKRYKEKYRNEIDNYVELYELYNMEGLEDIEDEIEDISILEEQIYPIRIKLTIRTDKNYESDLMIIIELIKDIYNNELENEEKIIEAISMDIIEGLEDIFNITFVSGYSSDKINKIEYNKYIVDRIYINRGNNSRREVESIVDSVLSDYN